MRAETGKGSWIERTLRPLRAAFGGAARQEPPATAYEYQPQVAQLSYEEAAELLEKRGRRVVRSGVDCESPGVVEAVAAGLRALDAPLEEYRLDPERFARFEEKAQYAERYPDYYGVRMVEKHVEHFLALELLRLGPGDVFVDIASEDSPAPDIFARLTGATTYWQDIQYEPGLHGRRIGGDACAMPLPDGFATAAALTCSIEHFERDADMRLCDELGRVLRPGGRLVIAPLYMSPEPAVQTDPVYSAQADVPFDDGVTIYCQRDWRNRHGRYYSPRTLEERVLARLGKSFDCSIRRIANHEAIEGHIYLRFALSCRRR
jgi:SAM-dependent methyltransferase